jgi:hypothetical protein
LGSDADPISADSVQVAAISEAPEVPTKAAEPNSPADFAGGTDITDPPSASNVEADADPVPAKATNLTSFVDADPEPVATQATDDILFVDADAEPLPAKSMDPNSFEDLDGGKEIAGSHIASDSKHFAEADPVPAPAKATCADIEGRREISDSPTASLREMLPPSRGGKSMSEVGHVAGITSLGSPTSKEQVVDDENENEGGDSDQEGESDQEDDASNAPVTIDDPSKITLIEPVSLPGPIKKNDDKEADDVPTQSDVEESFGKDDDEYSDAFDDEESNAGSAHEDSEEDDDV